MEVISSVSSLNFKVDWENMRPGDTVISYGKETSTRSTATNMNQKYRGQRYYKASVNRAGAGVIITRVY